MTIFGVDFLEVKPFSIAIVLAKMSRLVEYLGVRPGVYRRGEYLNGAPLG
jgi:hypothetical protein